MSAAVDLSMHLGAATEARFAAAFAVKAIIDVKAAGKLLGLDARTLTAMTERGEILAVRRGQHEGYTERECRRYLIEGPAVECVKKAPAGKRATATGGNVQRVNFTDRTHRGR